MPKSKVMIVDDHAMIRHGMAMLINMEADMEVACEAGDGPEAIEVLQKNAPVDILILDVSLKTVSGLEIIKTIRSMYPLLPVLFISMHDESVYAERALRSGARGYVMKQEPRNILITAIREVLKGNIFISKSIQEQVLKRIATRGYDQEATVSALTPSEFEIFHLIGLGYNTHEISNLLSRSIKTIETHRFNIRTKLKLKDTGELIRYATKWFTDQK
ncbi:response regulator transcription factor [Nitrosomonas sp. sh817]|jgi:DNA-binding NarL/FixJ family response regulator|uniref:response regulator n=1 Tax=Nitrosomonas sp. sh817 TaxID=3070658 RepID=UPI0027DB5C4C|nr:response regulator transcription factor [Nitrosomonas sp. sh817]WMJ09424.1 response regulator transcription factor [Nitrosomonas sp. sh817]